MMRTGTTNAKNEYVHCAVFADGSDRMNLSCKIVKRRGDSLFLFYLVYILFGTINSTGFIKIYLIYSI